MKKKTIKKISQNYVYVLPESIARLSTDPGNEYYTQFVACCGFNTIFG